MRTEERLRKLRDWAERELCRGRVLKAPGPNFDIAQIVTQEPHCHLGWAPSFMNPNGVLEVNRLPDSAVPGIIVMPAHSLAKNMEEQRFDRYKGVNRPQEMGQHLAIDMLFGVYEPGIRMPGFVESVGESGEGTDTTLFREGTEQGFFTLTNWLDDAKAKLLGQKLIPETDLFVEEASVAYNLYSDQSFIVDRRPIYYGFIRVSFGCHADEEFNSEIEELLR